MGSKIGAVIDPRTDKLNQMKEKIIKERINPMDINLSMLTATPEVNQRRMSTNNEVAPLLKELSQPYISPGDGEPGSGTSILNNFPQFKKKSFLYLMSTHFLNCMR